MLNLESKNLVVEIDFVHHEFCHLENSFISCRYLCFTKNQWFRDSDANYCKLSAAVDKSVEPRQETVS